MLRVMDGFYQGRRVLVTGHTGFKGAWMCLLLARAGAKVLGYSLDPPSTPSLFSLTRMDAEPLAGLASIHADVLDLPRLTQAVAEFDPEVVIHMAAQSLVRPSYADPAGTFAANVMGTVNLLEACRRNPPQKGQRRAIVVVTSDKCYENREWVHGYRETDRLGGHDPYSASKGCAEIAAQSYARSFFGPETLREHGTIVSTARAGNVIGGGDFATDRLVPDMARAFAKGEAVRIRRPQAVRPWQHALEPVSAYLLLARRMVESGHQFAGPWNFGPSSRDVRTVGAVAARFAELWGPEASLDLTRDKDTGPHEAGLLTLDCAKAHALLGWRPRLDLDAALVWTCGWYRAWADGPSSKTPDLRELCNTRIDEFFDE
ncbi:MAG: CDP-glucose 4,6-dehydratase [Humidesulfovibrio sp.]|uniref:CDP-glucose 4,6-dehydratase n=1 Tax=Humidesulfovibrio sp. TaxID=2910988 RepID=UPI002732C0E8|nr:CDP-glucose 4,6-dehydratase [Humidesulfovibrio sp.]MDP2847063.1 CDP-glucose 4,6-dehydratase [Humidesulfovibrio sp.]